MAVLQLRILAPLLVVLLAGCAAMDAGVQDDPDVDAQERERLFEERRAALEQVETWRATGRAGITTPRERVSLSLDWREAPEGYRIDLRGPMGSGSVRLEEGPESVTLRHADGRTDRAADAGELLRRFAGLDLPVEVLRWWLRGLPAPGPEPEVLELDSAGRITLLEQAGWRVEYDGWQSDATTALPASLTLEGGDIAVRAVISEWEHDVGPGI